ncbi:M64 family metallopeptidase [Streptomyces sp. E11-3]|uniref:M64 family metallopeptidase n=1 Tax=Streptomyces sp. E11-3 TaxID=3110112 RepID=UPI003980C82B
MRASIRRSTAAAAMAAAVACALAAAPTAASADPNSDDRVRDDRVRVEIPGPEIPSPERTERGQQHENNGHPDAGSGYARVPVHGKKAASPRELSPAEARTDGRVTKVVDNGPSGDRLDVVFVGDGYTAAELDQFHTDVKAKWDEVTAVEPYTTYQGLFNVWAVDAVSKESGVSGDPDQDVVKDTALGSYFWCGDFERLLCVDERKVDAYAAKTPEVELVMVLANSEKYGGAGYNTPNPRLGYEGIATASAGNEQSGQVAIHETGHSLGKLADEYFYPDYPGYEEYTGPEPADSNISTLTADQLRESRTKWHRWLGETSPDGGTVGAYEGGGYYVTGLNRPTDASLMRVLGKPFNLPGTEAMIAGFYRHASVATAVTPTDRPLRRGDRARAKVPTLSGAARLDVQWYLDGRRVESLAGRTSVRVSDLRLRARDRGAHELTLRVTDPTDAVRDPEIAETLQTDVTWRVRR